jgi:tape measure domain-containing protein
MEVDPVILKLIADVRDYNSRVEQARRMTDERLGAIEKRSLSMSSGVTKGFSLAAKAAIGFATGFVTLDLAGKFLAIADEAKNLDAQLRLATAGFGSFAQAGEDVRRIAADTRSGLSETASLYGNFARASKELGATQSESARATETFAKTLKISGADANSAASATLQFGQALASGALRGDELNSILEASPRLARLLTESMGTSIGAIKQLGEEGKLTSDVLFRALTDRKFTGGIDAEFQELPVTFSDAMTQLENAAIITFGAFDRGGQFSSAIANFVSDGADGFRDLEGAAESFGREVRASLEGATAAFGPLISEIQRLLGIMNSQDWGKYFSMERELKDVDQFTGWLSKQGLGGALLTGNSASDWWNGRTSGTNTVGRYNSAKADAQARLKGEANDQWAADQFRYYDLMGNRIAGAPRSAPAPTKKTGRKGPSAESLAAKAERERLAAIRDEAQQAQEKARLEDDIIAARAALATAAKDVYSFEMQMIEREKAARNAEIATRVKLGELSEAQAAEQRGLVSELAKQRALRAIQNKREADQALQERALRDDVDTLSAVANATTNRRERVEVEKRILDLQHQIERARLEEAIAAGQVADVAKARANLEARQAADNAVLARDSAGPLDQYRERLRQRQENVGDEVEALVVEELDQVRDGIRGAIEKQLGVKDPLISGLLNLLIEQVILKPLADALAGASGGGGGGIGGALASIGGAIFGRASGGFVNGGQMYRVNEGASPGRVEGFIPQGSGHIVPLGRMNALKPGGGGRVFNITVDARNSVTPDGFAQDLSSKILRQAAQMDGQAAQATLKAMPGRMSQYQRDGF